MADAGIQRRTKLQMLSACFAALIVLSCTKPTDLFDAEKQVYRFAGVQSATISVDGTVTLLWDKIPSDKNVNYAIYQRSEDAAFDFSNPVEIVNVATHKVQKYSANEKYCFAVRYLIVGINPDTNTTEICPNLPYVKTFAGIQAAEVVGLGAVKVSWNAPELEGEISGFKIYSDSEFSNVIDSAAADETEKVIGGIPVDLVATLGVRVVDKYGRTDTNTKTISVNVVNNAALIFKGLETATQVSARSVKLTWLPPAGSPTEYRLYKSSGTYNTTPTMGYSNVYQTVNKNLNQVTISDLGDEQSHCFVLRSVSSGGQEDSNTEARCIALPDAGPPVFSGIKTATFAEGAAQIAWDAADGEVAKFKVYYNTGTSMNYATFVEILAPATAHTLSGLSDNQNYTFAVRAVDSRNQSDSNTQTRTAYAGDLTPPVFNGLVSLVTVAGSETELKLSFNKSTDADLNYYKFRYRISGQTVWTDASTTVSPQSSATIEATLSGLLPATLYDVLIRAFDTSGNPSTNTSYLTRKTNDATPPTFNGLTTVASAPSDASKARVSWNVATDAGGVKEYRVYHSSQSLVGKTLVRTATYPLNYEGSGQIINMSPAITSGTSYDVSGLNENTLNYFVVHAIDNADNEDTNTAQQSFTMPYFTPPAAPTGLGFSVTSFPTANRSPFVTGQSLSGYKVKIYVDGALNAQQDINATGSFSIQLSALPQTSGTYLVKASHVNPSGVEGPQADVGSYQILFETPTAVLSGAPTDGAQSNQSTLAVTVSGTNVTHYRYSFMVAQTTSCASAIYSSWTVVATQITDSLGADGLKRLCVVARNATGFEQDVGAATKIDWTKNTQPPAAPVISSLRNALSQSTTITYSPEVEVTVAAVSGATKYCFKIDTTTAPLSTDVCWNVGTTQSLTISSASTSVYAYAMDTAGNISTASSAATITYTNICDSGLLAQGQTCTISTAKTLTNGQYIAGQGSMTITSSGSFTGNAAERATIHVGGDLNIASSAGTRITANITLIGTNITVSGAISATGLGYQTAAGSAGEPGASGGGLETSACGVAKAGGGGGHAGAGGAGFYSTVSTIPSATGGVANPALDFTQPITFGGSGGGNSGSSVQAGAGGGAIKIVATSQLAISSAISVNGTNGAWASCSAAGIAGGGGAGGSIWITAGSISGTGTLSAQGGVGGLSSMTYYGGAGGGGAISVSSSNAFKGTVNIDPGSVGSSYVLAGYPGHPGKFTVQYTNPCDSGTLSTSCTLSNPIVWGTSQTFAGTGDLVIASGGALKGPAKMQKIAIAMTGSITVQSGGSILANLSNVTGTNFTIDSGGIVSANELGSFGSHSKTHSEGNSGALNSTGANGTGGGGHGGRGGAGGANPTNGSFASPAIVVGGMSVGSWNQPTAFGGAGGSNSYYVTQSAFGGGAIKISVSNSLTVNGTLSTNGANGFYYGGGGAGGSIWLNVPTVSGAGLITANGGSGNAGTATLSSGGGSGGRIASYHTNTFSGTIAVEGGPSVAGVAGDVGTIYFDYPSNYCSSGSVSTTCTILRAWYFPNNATFGGTGNLIVGVGGQLTTYRSERATISFDGNVTVQNGGKLSGNFTVNANNFTVNSGGVVSAAGLGYLSTYLGTGEGYQVGSGGYVSASLPGGGAHGGIGGGPGGVATYGSAAAPITFGSAGGTGTYGGANTSGGNGGGALRFNVVGTTQIDGNVLATGNAGAWSGAYYAGGGGAGGSIFISTGTFSGSGVLNANGGAGGCGANTGYAGGGGGGGRISVVKSSSTFSGTQSANGGSGCPGATIVSVSNSGAGTVQ